MPFGDNGLFLLFSDHHFILSICIKKVLRVLLHFKDATKKIPSLNTLRPRNSEVEKSFLLPLNFHFAKLFF